MKEKKEKKNGFLLHYHEDEMGQKAPTHPESASIHNIVKGKWHPASGAKVYIVTRENEIEMISPTSTLPITTLPVAMEDEEDWETTKTADENVFFA